CSMLIEDVNGMLSSACDGLGLTSGFTPPFRKGGMGGISSDAVQANPPLPPFAKGGDRMGMAEQVTRCCLKHTCRHKPTPDAQCLDGRDSLVFRRRNQHNGAHSCLMGYIGAYARHCTLVQFHRPAVPEARCPVPSTES